MGKEDDKMIIEEMIDNHSLRYVRQLIAEICFEKSEHIRSNWQDYGLARSWAKLGEAYDSLNVEGFDNP